LPVQKTPIVGVQGRGICTTLFPLNVPMDYSPKHTFIANASNPTGVGLAPGKTIYFGSLEFTVDCLGHLSLSPLEGDSGAIFVGMVHNGMPSLHTTLEDSFNEGGAASGKGEAPDRPAPEGAMW
jgi:hypothetical protein